MRKIRIDRNTEINEKVVKWIIEKHKVERDRISNLRGYDVINNEFFVEESIATEKQGRSYIYDETKITFSTFNEYYDFLDGDIYENSCYYQFVFTDDLVNTYKIDLEKLSFSIELDSTIDKLKSDVSNRKQKYRETKKKLKERKTWIEKFYEAKTYDDFMLVVHNYQRKHGHG